jgi:hypothetical protein
VTAEKNSKFDLNKAVSWWSNELIKVKKDRKNLSVKIFETKKQ